VIQGNAAAAVDSTAQERKERVTLSCLAGWVRQLLAKPLQFDIT